MNNRQEQIEQAKRLIATGISEELIEVLQQQFPELKESEDERIRKMLIEMMERWKKAAEDNNVKQDVKDASAAIAYLERQKEQKDYKKLYEEVVKSDWFKENYVGKSLGEEQQPAEWSEEDEALIENVCTALKGYALHERKVDLDEHAHRLEEMSERLKSIRPQPHWKPSEKQMDELRYALLPGYGYDCDVLQGLYEDLKKLL